MIESLKAPVNKVGLVLLRNVNSADPEVCLVQVKAKNPAEQDKVDFGLAKGTRQYFDKESGEWRDARDFMTAAQYKADLEPVFNTLCKEGEEEIGVAAQDIARGPVKLLGERLFAPRDGSLPYDIQWFVMEADAHVVGRMDPHPVDAHEVRWFSKSQVDALDYLGKINPNYATVIKESIEKARNKELTPAPFAAQAQLA